MGDRRQTDRTSYHKRDRAIQYGRLKTRVRLECTAAGFDYRSTASLSTLVAEGRACIQKFSWDESETGLRIRRRCSLCAFLIAVERLKR